jgi:putative transposase
MVKRDNGNTITSGMNTWRAGCGGSRTSGSEGGPGKPISRNADRAPRSDPYTDLRNRGVKDVFFVVCDGLKGLPEVVANVWPQAIVQTCIIHLIRNTFRLTSRKYWDELKRDVKPIYTAPSAAAARVAFDELGAKWGGRYPAVVRLWDNAWEEFIPFLDYDVEIRQVICSTNAIESLNARYRRAIRARGHFPSEQAALKCLYLVTRSLDPTGVGRTRWTMRWKPALNAFAITFADRFPAAETY